MHFCYLMFYVMLAMYGLVYYVSFIGLSIQNSFSNNHTASTYFDFLYYYNSTTLNAYHMTVSMLICVFLVVAIVISFLAYREFKAIFFERVGLSSSMLPNFGQNRSQPSSRSNNARSQNPGGTYA